MVCSAAGTAQAPQSVRHLSQKVDPTGREFPEGRVTKKRQPRQRCVIAAGRAILSRASQAHGYAINRSTAIAVNSRWRNTSEAKKVDLASLSPPFLYRSTHFHRNQPLTSAAKTP